MATKEKTKKATKKTTEKKSPTTGFIPDLVTMLEAGTHFGHERSKRNPRMEPYIFMQRNRVAIIDLQQTQEALKKAAQFAYDIASRPNNEILFVGTKRQARSIVRSYAEQAQQPYVTKRWLGGTLTNFATILKSIEKLDELKRTEGSPQVEKLTKKEKAVRNKEMQRLEEVLEGIKTLKTMPAAIFVVGAHDERIAVREADRVGIPIIGITDTNADPGMVDYPIPANDDAIRSIDLIVSVITKSVLAAKGESTDVKTLQQKPVEPITPDNKQEDAAEQKEDN